MSAGDRTPARDHVDARLREIAERDPLALLLADDDGPASAEDRAELWRHVEDDYVRRAQEVAAKHSALAAGLLADVSYDEMMVENVESLMPGADADPLLAARERIWWTAVAAADTDGAIARDVRRTYDAISAAFLGATADVLAANGRRPRDGMMLDDLVVLLGIFTDGLTSRGRIDPDATPEYLAMQEARVFWMLTEEDPDHVPAPAEGDEADPDAPAAIDRRLARLGSMGPDAMADHVRLLRAAQTDDDALLRARLRSDVLLRRSDLRTLPGGVDAWRLAALTLGVLDAATDATVHDAVEDRPDGPEHPRDALARVRALLRLGRPGEAAALAGVLAERTEAEPLVRALARVHEAEARLATGDPGPAIALATGHGAPAEVRAGAARAFGLVAAGRLDEAADALSAARSASRAARPDRRSGVALALATAEHALARGRTSAAHDAARAAGDLLKRSGDRHPAAGAWRLVAARALLADGQRRQARRLVDEHDLSAGPRAAPGLRRASLVLRAQLTRDPAEAALLDAEARLLEDEAAAAAPTVAAVAALPPRDPDPRGIRVEGLGLTPRVQEVVALVARGMRDAEIAHELGISLRTVNRHVAAALKATDTRNRVELTRLVLGPGED